MANGYTRQIVERIQAADDGAVFVNSDIVDIVSAETVRRTLNRLTQAGKLRRVLKGVYEKPEWLPFKTICKSPPLTCVFEDHPTY